MAGGLCIWFMWWPLVWIADLEHKMCIYLLFGPLKILLPISISNQLQQYNKNEGECTSLSVLSQRREWNILHTGCACLNNNSNALSLSAETPRCVQIQTRSNPRLFPWRHFLESNKFGTVSSILFSSFPFRLKMWWYIGIGMIVPDQSRKMAKHLDENWVRFLWARCALG